MIWQVLHLGVVLMVWATALDKYRTLRPGLVQQAGCRTLVAVALVLTIMLPWVYAGVGHLTGVPNLAVLLGDVLAVVGSWTFQPLVAELQRTFSIQYQADAAASPPIVPRGLDRVLGDRWVMLGTVAALGLLFLLAPVHGAPTPDYGTFMARYAGAPFVAEYTFVFMGYLGARVFEFLWLAWVASHRPTVSQPLRLRARLQAFGWAAALTLIGHECLYAFAHRLSLPYPVPAAGVVRNTLLITSVFLLMSGGLLDLHHWWVQWRTHRRLYPLWCMLYRVVPTVATDPFFPPARSVLADALALDQIELRLHRRVVNIEDAALALQPYIDAAAVERVARLCATTGVSGDDTEVIVTATRLRSAVEARLAGVQAGRPTPILQQDEGGNGRASSPEGEVTRLRRVAQAYRSSPLVAVAVAHEDADPNSPARTRHDDHHDDHKVV